MQRRKLYTNVAYRIFTKLSRYLVNNGIYQSSGVSRSSMSMTMGNSSKMIVNLTVDD